MTDHPHLQLPIEITNATSASDAVVCTWSHPLWPSAWTQEHTRRFGPPLMPRRILLKAQRSADRWTIRIESFTEKQGFAKGWQGSLEELVHVLWTLGFGQLLLQTPDQDVQCRRNAKRSTLTVHAPTRHEWQDLIVDRSKRVPLPVDQFTTLLIALDLASADGSIRAPMADKYRQLNHLITIIEQLPPFRDAMPGTRISIVDAGCGKAYLSLALCAVLVERGVDAHVYGVDTNAHVIDHCNAVASSLGFGDRCTFERSSISDVRPRPMDLLLALHACDTATDEALALGIRSHAHTMIVAPCCHHYVQQQLSRSAVPAFARPLLEDGIIKERLGDMLTDSLRRDIVGAFGYDASLEEFIALEHTAKNVMLKCCARSDQPVTEPDPTRLAALRAYSDAWHAMPKLYELITDLLPTDLLP